MAHGCVVVSNEKKKEYTKNRTLLHHSNTLILSLNGYKSRDRRGYHPDSASRWWGM